MLPQIGVQFKIDQFPQIKMRNSTKGRRYGNFFALVTSTPMDDIVLQDNGSLRLLSLDQELWSEVDLISGNRFDIKLS